MRLKNIKIIGFKSFADKTQLDFDEGITGVVGPNGCGKSNIADAFRWVLGEQSAKSLRGHRMPDVIFAGTTTRKPVNFAEVTITLSDVEGALPFQYEEIAVTRRLHRSGESDYFINNQSVRLKDIQDMFLDSGVGKNAFSIFEQGKIDQVINYSPLERRSIFEEAAGILRFLQRKKEALRKLELADLNVERIKDIHQEVEKQIVVLEQQAEKARLYKENRVQSEALEKALLVGKWDQVHKRESDTLGKESSHQDQIAEACRNLEAAEGLLKQTKSELQEAEKALRARSEEVYQTRSEKEIKSREKQSHHERLKEVLIKEKRWQLELESMLEKRDLRHNERVQAETKQKKIEEEINRLDSVLKEQKDKAAAVEQVVADLRDRQQELQKELFKILQQESLLESELKQNTIRLENTLERTDLLTEKKEKLAGQLQEIAVQMQERQNQVQVMSEELENHRERFSALDAQHKELSDRILVEQETLDTLRQEINESKARHKVLGKMHADMEGFSAGSKRFLQESMDANSPLYGILKGLYELITPEKGSEDALAAVLRPYAQTLVVETTEDLEKALAFARENSLNDFSLLCLAGIRLNPASPVTGLISFLTKVSAHEAAVHLLKDVYIVETPQCALKLVYDHPGTEAWVREGIHVDRRGVVSSSRQGESNVFLREAELHALTETLRIREAKRAESETGLKTLQQRRAHVHTEQMEMDKAIRRSEMKLMEFNFALQRMQGDKTKVLHEYDQIDRDVKSLAETAKTLEITLQEVQGRHVKAKASASEFRERTAAVSVEAEAQGGSFKRENAILRENEAEYQKICEENRKLLHAIHVVEVKDLESLHQEKRLREEIGFGKEMQTEILSKSMQMDVMLKEVDHVLEQVTKTCADMEGLVSGRREAVEKLEAQLVEMRELAKRRETELHQIGILAAQLAAAKEAIEGELRERFQLHIDDARAMGLPLEKSLEQTERRLRALRQELEAAGDVNMTSIEECERHKERYAFYNQQLDDLGTSKQELVQVIAGLDGESRKIFKETFALISANFKKNFQILFDGGEADLQFTDTEDVLEAGIEIIARPPGKQMRSINLLSGGEKCLTAMALLFAIFETKPAPFCILDEIDAPLDDTNVERFLNVVRHFADKCQFIIITHNKRTMAIADVLFGVSMQERGVSKLLSMVFSTEGTQEPQLVS